MILFEDYGDWIPAFAGMTVKYMRRGKMWQLFGDESESIINELNEALAA